MPETSFKVADNLFLVRQTLDNAAIQAVTEAPQSVSFKAMAERQGALAEAILEDPAVASLSSFIGVDGSNPTLNTGRFLINLKPRPQREHAAWMRRRTGWRRRGGSSRIFMCRSRFVRHRGRDC